MTSHHDRDLLLAGAIEQWAPNIKESHRQTDCGADHCAKACPSRMPWGLRVEVWFADGVDTLESESESL